MRPTKTDHVSDADLELSHALALPTFDIDGMMLIRRLTMIIDNGRIERIFYPVFPPDAATAGVLDALRQDVI